MNVLSESFLAEEMTHLLLPSRLSLHSHLPEKIFQFKRLK